MSTDVSGWKTAFIFWQTSFAIDVCAYAVMSNHTHLVLHIHQGKSQQWNAMEVIQRWHRLHKGTLLTQQYCQPALRQEMSKAQIITLEETVDIWRRRLSDISWFMRSLNEYIARQANQEDNCTGRFREGRFKSQALLDEAALAACMAWVDLNPVRAKMAQTPVASDHTSIQYRINAARVDKTACRLMPFAGNHRKDMPHGLPFGLTDYFELVDITARQLARNKRGVICGTLPAILTRLHISPEQWAELSTSFEQCFHVSAGRESSLADYRQHHNLRRLRDKKNARRLFG